MTTLIIEDGSGVDNANSYIDVAYLDAYASLRGFDLPQDTPDKEQFLVRGYDYLQYRLAERECQFTEIPDNLKKALAQLVVEQQKGTLLWPKPITSSVEGFVTEKTLGPMTKKFAAGSGTGAGTGRADPKEPICIASVEVFLKSVLESDACPGGSNSCNWAKTVRA